MNPTLIDLAEEMQKAAMVYIPMAYQLGREKAQTRYGIVVPWRDVDAVHVEMLLNRHAQELATSFGRMELEIIEGKPMADALETLANTVGRWAWALEPAQVMGLASYVDATRTEIGREEGLPAEDIGVLWLTARDAKVCPRCHHLNGRWFPATEAYELAATVHPLCRCSRYFDVGVPSDAMVGPMDAEDERIFYQQRRGQVGHVFAGLGG